MFMKTCKTAVCATALMAVVAWSGGAFAAVSENFEGTVDSQLALGTAGTVGTGTPTQPSCGYPCSVDADVKVLAVTGTVTYTDSPAPSSTGISQVDLMFKAEPTDELDALESDVKIALAVATNSASLVSLKLWCKATSSAAADWIDIGNVSSSAWSRATIVLDYGNGLCRVSIDGDPVVKGNVGSDWYTGYFAKGSDTYLNSVTMVGSTEVDDFVVSHTTAASYTEPFSGTAATVDGVAISYDALNKYGVTKDEAISNQDLSPNQAAGMTVSQKIAAGLNPKSATKFEMKTMAVPSATSATITFPGNNASYVVKATVDAAGTGASLGEVSYSQGAADANGEKTNTATFSNLPDSDLIYFHLSTSAQ